MAAIYLIRHGQASFGSSDYDKLSVKGSKQSVLLGRFWRKSVAVNQFYCGDLLRHNQTLKCFTDGYKADKTPTIIHSGFNEFDHVDILTNYNEQWRDFVNISTKINQQEDANKTFQKEFFLALHRWIFNDKDHEYKESWSQFKIRCIRAIQDIIEQELAFNRQLTSANSNDESKGKDILVFTSAGTISVIVQHILNLSDEHTLQLNQQCRNTSVTKLLFSDNSLSIDYFNNYSHLEQAGDDWVTFR